MLNTNVIIKKDGGSKALFFNYENKTPFTKITKNCNMTLSVINGKSVLNVWWRIPNINQEFYKTISLNLSGPIFVDVFELSAEFNAILLKLKDSVHLYKFDKYQHEHEFVGEFEDVKFFNTLIFSKKDSTLNIFNKYFELIDKLENVDVFEVLQINSNFQISLFSKINSSLMFWNIGNDQKFKLVQMIPLGFKPLQIVNVKHGSNQFLATHSIVDGGNLKIFKMAENKWKLYTSTSVPDIQQIVPLRDDSLIFLLISQKFKNIQVLNVI